ncbi:hypothetical protein FHG87_013393, partial [Trinorchestia longiramus]
MDKTNSATIGSDALESVQTNTSPIESVTRTLSSEDAANIFKNNTQTATEYLPEEKIGKDITCEDSGTEIIAMDFVSSVTPTADAHARAAGCSAEPVRYGAAAAAAPEAKTKRRLSLAALSGLIVPNMEKFFESHGRWVARHPVITVLVCVIITATTGLGVLNFQKELRPFKLWLPQDSAFIKMLEWQNEHFPTHFRRQMLMWEAPNVLSAEAIREMWRLHLAITAAIEPKSGKTWSDLCARLPSLTVEETSADYDDYELGTLEFRRRRRETIEELDDISFALSRDSYCGALEDMPSFCYETSLLEIWGLNEDVIMSLTDEQ